MNTLTTVSIVCPVYNEANYIDDLLQSLLGKEEINKELILVDGGSQDETIAIITARMKMDARIKLIHNPERYVSQGFNKAYAICSGQYIALVGAHAIYPKNYFSKAVYYLQHESADAVGGPLQQTGKGEKGKGIAFAMSCKFGVGGTEFRTANEKKYVQSVAFAVYKKEVFEKVGLLDEQLIRNQDDEFHYRMNSRGMKILMIPDLACIYFVRESYASLYKQYYGYGYYKPLVLRKVSTGLRPRHLIPGLFAFYLLSLPLAFFEPIWIIPFVFYLLGAFYFAFIPQKHLKGGIYALFSFPVLHVSYGLGFLRGMFLKWN
jgi:glycosyltransferase involved in cell wall biosynthesis